MSYVRHATNGIVDVLRTLPQPKPKQDRRRQQKSPVNPVVERNPSPSTAYHGVPESQGAMNHERVEDLRTGLQTRCNRPHCLGRIPRCLQRNTNTSATSGICIVATR